jgi:hypothetical protein
MTEREYPMGHEGYQCDHCGEDFRLHTRTDQFNHAMQKPNARIYRDDVVSRGLKTGASVSEVAAQMPDGKIQQRDIQRMVGRE